MGDRMTFERWKLSIPEPEFYAMTQENRERAAWTAGRESMKREALAWIGDCSCKVCETCVARAYVEELQP